MKRFLLVFCVGVGSLLLPQLNSFAQEAVPAKKRPPRLTSEDVNRSRSQGSVTIVKSFDPNKWTKYQPGNLGLALELPGGLDLTDVIVPEKLRGNVPPEIHSFRAFSYLVDPFHAFIVYAHFKSPPTSAELKKTAVLLVEAFAQRYGRSNVRFGADPTEKFKNLFWASYTQEGYLLNLMGSVQAKGDKVWVIMTVSHQGDEISNAMAKRVAKSATFY
jgi:hypothetical protein